eukprot:7192570-Heterocapsa_arctica.AAC.1
MVQVEVPLPERDVLARHLAGNALRGRLAVPRRVPAVERRGPAEECALVQPLGATSARSRTGHRAQRRGRQWDRGLETPPARVRTEAGGT